MAPIKRRRLPALKGKVARCSTLQQLQAVFDNAGDKLVFVHYTALWNPTCKKMAAFITELSRKPEYAHVRFAEIDVQQVPDAVKAYGVKGLPGIQCWRSKECLENTVHNAPFQVLEVLTKHAGSRPSSSSGPTPWWAHALRVLAAGAVAAAAWAAYNTLSGGGDAAADEIKRLDTKIAATRAVAEGSRGVRGGRRRSKKEVRAAKKQLEQLLERREQLQAVVDGSSSTATAPGLEAADYDDDDYFDEQEAAAALAASASKGKQRRQRGASGSEGGDAGQVLATLAASGTTALDSDEEFML